MSSAEEYLIKKEKEKNIRKLEWEFLQIRVLLGLYIFSLLYSIKDLSNLKIFLAMISQIIIVIFTEKKKQYYKKLKEFENSN